VDGSGLRDVSVTIYEFCKWLNLILVHFSEILTEDFFKNWPDISFFVDGTMLKELLGFANHISYINDLTVFDEAGSAILNVSKLEDDLLPDDNLFTFNKQIPRCDNISKLRHNVIPIVN